MAGTFNESNHQSEIDTWETNWPIDVRTNISALASGASTQVYGVAYGVHEG